jgi:hypothetical protein
MNLGHTVHLMQPLLVFHPWNTPTGKENGEVDSIASKTVRTVHKMFLRPGLNDRKHRDSVINIWDIGHIRQYHRNATQHCTCHPRFYSMCLSMNIGLKTRHLVVFLQSRNMATFLSLPKNKIVK